MTHSGSLSCHSLSGTQMVLLTLINGGVSHVGFSVVSFRPMVPFSGRAHASGDTSGTSPPGRDAGPGDRVSSARRRKRPRGREECTVGQGGKGALRPGGGGPQQQQR